MHRHRIYYGDGSVATDWDASPADDIQLVLIHRGGDHQQIVQGEDEYRLPELGTSVKFGRWMADDEYQELVERAIADGW